MRQGLTSRGSYRERLLVNQGYLHNDWTSANVTPDFKNGSKHLIAIIIDPLISPALRCNRLERSTCTTQPADRDYLKINDVINKLTPFQGKFQKANHARLNYLRQYANGPTVLTEPCNSSHVVLTNLSNFKPLTLYLMHECLLLKLEHVARQQRKTARLDWELSSEPQTMCVN